MNYIQFWKALSYYSFYLFKNKNFHEAEKSLAVSHDILIKIEDKDKDWNL